MADDQNNPQRPYGWKGNEGKYVSLEEAGKATRRYRENSVAFNEINKGKKGGYFGKDKIAGLTNQEGAVGVRIYFGFDESGESKFYLTGVDSAGNDILDGNNGEALVLDWCLPCPFWCPKENALTH